VIFQPTPLTGAFVIELERVSDNRGFFARSWCEREFAAQGLTSSLTQCNVSFNHQSATLRGMHYQSPPYEETKLVRCTMGAVFDVIVDMRPASPTYRQWFAVELSAENHRMLFIPGQFAHGFQTLTDNTELFYQMTGNYHPASAVGFRWNDPSIAIQWPLNPTVMAARDQEWADLPVACLFHGSTPDSLRRKKL
jgi:dTDP-4-dehydrorhamnose 3,5-epimerase